MAMIYLIVSETNMGKHAKKPARQARTPQAAVDYYKINGLYKPVAWLYIDDQTYARINEETLWEQAKALDQLVDESPPGVYTARPGITAPGPGSATTVAAHEALHATLTALKTDDKAKPGPRKPPAEVAPFWWEDYNGRAGHKINADAAVAAMRDMCRGGSK